jgi:pimeloyl-ACP methyl ester carboxylesterase
MSIAKVGDINLYYEVHGEGEPLVLIMGYTLRGGRGAELRDKLAGEYRVIVPDNRGTGRSDKPEMPYTATMMAGDVADLLDVLEIDTANVFGYSMGGQIAQEFALNYPDRLNSLILASTSCGGSRAVLPTPEDMAVFFNPELFNMPPEEASRAWLPLLWSEDFVQKNPAIIDRYVAIACEYPTPQQTAVSHQNVLMTHDTYKRLPDIKAPTLVIVGTEDRLMPCENSKLLASRIPNAELVIIENAGHGLFISDPTEKVSKTVLDFLRRHSKARAKN